MRLHAGACMICARADNLSFGRPCRNLAGRRRTVGGLIFSHGLPTL